MNIAHLSTSKEPVIIGYSFLTKHVLYSTPIFSSELDTYIVKDLSNTLQYWSVSTIKSKLFVLIFNYNCIVVPLIHTKIQNKNTNIQIYKIIVLVKLNCKYNYIVYLCNCK